MDWFNKFFDRVKEQDVVEGTVSFIIDKKGDKYLHINQFREFLEEYKIGITDPSQIGVLNQIITVLNEAND